MQGKKPRNPEKIRNVNENAEGTTEVGGGVNASWQGGIRRGMRGMCGPFGGEWAQEKRSFALLTVSRELDWGACVLRERHRTYWLYLIDQGGTCCWRFWARGP